MTKEKLNKVMLTSFYILGSIITLVLLVHCEIIGLCAWGVILAVAYFENIKKVKADNNSVEDYLIPDVNRRDPMNYFENRMFTSILLGLCILTAILRLMFSVNLNSSLVVLLYLATFYLDFIQYKYKQN